MGSGLTKPVTSVVIQRRGGESFRVGLSEMNGWRSSMEDAHVIHLQQHWGFFGVYDGHGGAQCSAFIARRVEEELCKSGMPEDRKALKDMCLALDQEFLDYGEKSGTTGTFAIVKLPETSGGKFSLRIGNVGDSRVLLGHADGSIHPGPGTDSGLTTDHKPDHPDEEARIMRTGGYVSQISGVSRVNGDLAVSRAFGDAVYKETGGPGLEDRPVTADPELLELECDASDFLMLVCDGISEGAFPNAEVVQLAAAQLREHGDPGRAATAVCRQALQANSKDNLTCMIVMLSGGVAEPSQELLPGPYSCPRQAQFVKAYEAMAAHVGMSLAEAVEKRYGLATKELQEAKADGTPSRTEELQEEISLFEEGPPGKAETFGEASLSSLSPGSDEMRLWFERCLQAHGHYSSEDDRFRREPPSAVEGRRSVLVDSNLPSEAPLSPSINTSL